MIDRHCLGTGSGARGAEGLREEHPDVAEKLDSWQARMQKHLSFWLKQSLPCL